MRFGWLLLLAALAGNVGAWAAAPSTGSAAATVTARPPPTAAVKPPTPEQQRRLKRCTADVTQRGLKGTARRQYLTACLRRK
jgi:hypothetical protein